MSEDDSVTDALADHLLAYDQLLSAESTDDSAALQLADAAREELEPAFNCLRLLNAWRIARQFPSNSAPDQHFPPPTSTADSHTFGRFTLRRELGRGGFGVVHLAFDPLLQREVALKLPRLDVVLNAPLRERFVREGRAAAGLAHPNLVTVYEAGEYNGICYLAMAYCPGPTLSEWLRCRTEPVPPTVAASLVAQLADGLEHAHRRGVLHRDLKPANVLLTDEDTPKITDFGLARLVDRPTDQTRSGMLLGTPRYMAPEQAEGDVRSIGTHTDVHALGMILYEMLTGAPPFTATSDLELLRQITADEPASPSTVRREVSRDLASICLKCLEKQPQRRYATAGELAEDLRRFLDGKPVTARPPSTLERAVKWSRRRPTLAALVAVSLLALLSLAGVGVWHSLSLEAKNVALRAALDDATEQRQLAQQGERQLRRVVYGLQVRSAFEQLRTDQIGLMGGILNRLRPGPGEEDLREFAWHYLWRLARNELVLSGGRGQIRWVAFSSDSRTLACVTIDRIVQVWDTVEGELRRTLLGFETIPGTVAFSGDGRWLVVASQGMRPLEVRVWDAVTGKPGGTFKDSAMCPGVVAISPDGRTVAITRDPTPEETPETLVLWTPVTGQKRELVTDYLTTTAAVFSPDGQTLAAACQTVRGGPTRIVLFDVCSGQAVSELEGHGAWIDILAYSPNGQTLASGGPDGVVRLWDLAAGKEIARYQEGDKRAYIVAFSADGRLLATIGSAEPSAIVRLRDAATGRLLHQPAPPPLHVVHGFALAPDGQTVALWTRENLVRLWKPTPMPASLSLVGHTGEAWAVAFSPDSLTLASASDDHTVKLWDPVVGKERTTLHGHTSLVSCLAFSPDGSRLATGSYDQTVKLWNPQDGSLLATLEGHTHAIRDVAFSPSGRLLASTGKDKTVRLWDVGSGTLRTVLQGHTNGARCLAFSPDGRLLASGGHDQQIRIWDVATATERFLLNEADQVWTIAFTPDGKTLVTGSADGMIRLWDMATRQRSSVLGGHVAGLQSVAVSADGRTLASAGSEGTVRLWHIETGQELLHFKDLGHKVHSVAFSPDGRFLAAALHDGSLRLWPAW